MNDFFLHLLYFRDAQLLHRAGPDGLLYISFQRHLIVFTFLIVVSSLSIALPINYNGTMFARDEEFARTTLVNLEPASYWFWAHTVINLSYVPIGMLIMRRFIKRVIIRTFLFQFIAFYHYPKYHLDENNKTRG